MRNFQVIFLYEQEHIVRFSNLHQCTFNSEILTDDEDLQIPGYSIARFDHPSNIKHGGVCVYYKTSLPLKLLDIKYLKKYINLELIIGDNL